MYTKRTCCVQQQTDVMKVVKTPVLQACWSCWVISIHPLVPVLLQTSHLPLPKKNNRNRKSPFEWLRPATVFTSNSWELKKEFPVLGLPTASPCSWMYQGSLFHIWHVWHVTWYFIWQYFINISWYYMTFDQIAWCCSVTVSTTDFAWPLHAVPWRPRPPSSNASRVRVNNFLMVGLWKDRRSKFCPISHIFTDSRCSCLTVFHGSWIALFLHLDFYTFLTTFLPTSIRVRGHLRT